MRKSEYLEWHESAVELLDPVPVIQMVEITHCGITFEREKNDENVYVCPRCREILTEQDAEIKDVGV